MQALRPRFRPKPWRINLSLLASLARLLSRSPGSGDGYAFLSESDMRVNVSFVLHQPSTSPDVIAAARSARRDRKMSSDPQIVYDGDPDILVDRWLVPGVGLPDDIASHVTSPVKFIDRGEQPLTQARFFNAPATLTLPANGNEMVGVAALIRRPGNRSLQLIVRGPYQLPNDIGEAIRTLETIIQAHVEQWNPGVRIWDAPAENLLPDLSGGGD